MIRDWIGLGLLDVKLSERLQLDADLTLTKAVLQAWQREAVKNNNHSCGTTSTKLQKLRKTSLRRKRGKHRNRRTTTRSVLQRKNLLIRHQTTVNAVKNRRDICDKIAQLRLDLSQVFKERSLVSCLQVVENSRHGRRRLCVPRRNRNWNERKRLVCKCHLKWLAGSRRDCNFQRNLQGSSPDPYSGRV